MKTSLQLRFRLWGADLDPDAVSAATGILPSRTFRVGEARGSAAKKVAGWEWISAWGGWDTDPLVEEFVRLFGPAVEVFRSAVNGGANVKLTVVGEVLGDLVSSPEEADAKGLAVPEDDEFRPFIDADRPSISLDERVLRVLADMGASVHTHIDFGLDEG